jgi:hypothetical protein
MVDKMDRLDRLDSPILSNNAGTDGLWAGKQAQFNMD